MIGLVLRHVDCDSLRDDVNVSFDDDNDEMEPAVNYCAHQRHERRRDCLGKCSQRSSIYRSVSYTVGIHTRITYFSKNLI